MRSWLSRCSCSWEPARPGRTWRRTPGGYGFWWGLWQGTILPVTFIVSLFTDTVSIYEVDNNGNWYDVGFVLGIALFSGPVVALRGRRS